MASLNSTPEILSSIVYELLDNAIKFTSYHLDGEGKVLIKVWFDAPDIYLQITDNGSLYCHARGLER